MPALGIALNTALIPYGMNPPFAWRGAKLKLPPWNLNSRTMIASTGMATFHHVITLFTRANIRIAKKFTAVKAAMRTIVIANPRPVTLRVVGL